MSAANEITGREILAIVSDVLPGVGCFCEHSGGGCATVYVGTPTTDADGDTRYAVLIGPGRFAGFDAGASAFTFAELYVGPDDDGADLDAALTVRNRDELRAAIAATWTAHALGEGEVSQ